VLKPSHQQKFLGFEFNTNQMREAPEPVLQDQTGVKQQSKIMRMDSWPTRENDGNDPGDWRSSITHPVHAKGSSEQFANASTELGSSISIINNRILTRTLLVDGIFSVKERITNTDKQVIEPRIDIFVDASDSRWGVFSKKIQTSGFWSKKEKESPINIQELRTILFVVQLHSYESEGQHIRIFCDNTTALKYAKKSGGRAHSRNQECQGGRIESGHQTNLRVGTTSEVDQEEPRPLGPSNNRCLCIKGKYKADQVLVVRSGSQCGSPRCLFTAVAEERSIHPSTLEVNTTGPSSVQRTASRRSNFDYLSMADAVLVADGNATLAQEVPPNANSHSRKVVESHRMEVIATMYRKQGLTEGVIILLKGCARKKTSRMHDLAWGQWRKFCRVEDYNPCEYNVKAVLSFLVKNKDYSWSQLNIFRSAIQSVYTAIHPAKPILSKQSLIKHFFLARKKILSEGA
jgi:hypothetical protein